MKYNCTRLGFSIEVHIYYENCVMFVKQQQTIDDLI